MRCRPALVAAALVGVMLTPPPAYAREEAPDPVRILVVGDSQTHGSVGDWTWRFRLWNNLTAQGIAVDFVGPHSGVLDPEAEDPDAVEDMRYADPGFDTDHAARWGMGYATMETPIGELVREFQPDIVVSMLGTVDLAFLDRTGGEAAASAGKLAEAARAADPDVDVVLAHVYDTWVRGAREANWWIDAIARDRDRPESRIVVAAAPEEYDKNVDTYDDLHPSATGEVKIAESVATALVELGVGARPHHFPLVSNGPPTPAELTATVRWRLVHLSWAIPLGATGVVMWRRDDGGPWRRVRPLRAFLSPEPGHVSQWRVQAFKGHAVAPWFSNTVTARR